MAASSSQMLPPLPRFKHADLVSGSRQARKSLAGVACAPCDDPDGLATGSGSAGITIAESASAAARYFLLHHLRQRSWRTRPSQPRVLRHTMPSTAFLSGRFAYQNMITWTLVIFVYSGSGTMIQSSITGYSSYAECNKAGSNWMKNERHSMKEYRCVPLKIDSGPRR